MRRSRAFILSEILMTMMLQAGFILVLCTSFYMLTSFYSKTQQVLTARSHAERVISFVDNKIRHAGLGLWGCGTSSKEVRDAIKPLTEHKNTDPKNVLENFKLPVAIMRDDTNTTPQTLPDKNRVQYGSYLTLLYADRDFSGNNDDETILIVTQNAPSSEISTGKYQSNLLLLDGRIAGIDSKNPGLVKKLFKANDQLPYQERNIERYAVTEGTGMPMYIYEVSETNPTKGQVTVYTYGSPMSLVSASELIPLKCMQMFVHPHPTDGDRQFAFRETMPISYNNSVDWNNTYNQEKGILEIYMELDTSTNIFTLYVLATGGYDASVSNPRPSAWPNYANPRPKNKKDNDKITDDEAKKAWLDSDYRYHITYVSRASWKLNNIPPNFDWSN